MNDTLSPYVFPGLKYRGADVAPDKLMDVVCDVFGIDRVLLLSASRRRQYVTARFAYMYCMYRSRKVTLYSIGQTMGGRDHTTVIHGVQAAKNLLDTDRDFRNRINQIAYSIHIPGVSQ